MAVPRKTALLFLLIVLLSGLFFIHPDAHAQSLLTPTYTVSPTTCADDGPGTTDQPFCTIQAGLDALAAGDVLLIRDGVYYERVYLPHSGTPDNPITIMGESHHAILDAGCADYPCDEAVILSSSQFFRSDDDEPLYSGFFIGWAEHVMLDGFTIRNAPLHAVELVAVTGVTLQNMRVENAALSLVNVYDSFDFKLLDSELSGGNLGRLTPEGVVVHITHEEAVSIVNTDGFEIAGNYLHDGFKEGLDVKVGSRNGIIRQNTVERFCAVGIYLNEVTGVYVMENTIAEIGFIRNTMSDIGPRSDEVQRCDEVLTGPLVVQPEWGAEGDARFRQNGIGYEPGVGLMLAVGDLGDELSTGELARVGVFQNIIHDVNVGCIWLWDELRENGSETGTLAGVQLFNNTLVNCARSRAGWGPGIVLDRSADGTSIINNIIAFANPAVEDGGATSTLANYNLFFQADMPVGTNQISGDPLFVNPAGGDFRLQAGSPAVDAGFPVSLPYAGEAPDLGALDHGLEP